MIQRVRWANILRGETWWHDGRPYVLDTRSMDIPETIAGMIRNAAPGLVALSLRPAGGQRMVIEAERAARRRGARIIWLPYRGDANG